MSKDNGFNFGKGYSLAYAQCELCEKIPLEMLETPKAHTPKRSYETRTSVKVTKVEKSCEINIRLKPKCLNNNGQSAGKS